MQITLIEVLGVAIALAGVAAAVLLALAALGTL
jgi:hypothetical protein